MEKQPEFDLGPAQVEQLRTAALEVRLRAFAPYSQFLVGAAILDRSGRIISGANVENVSYGLTICAERVAACTAVTSGHRDWEAIAIASRGGVTPCGACRQFLNEFASKLTILLIDADTRLVTCRTSLDLLLPGAFKFLKEEINPRSDGRDE